MRSAMGFWLHRSHPALIIEGYDAGVSFRSTHPDESRTTVSVLGNSSEGAWPVMATLARDIDLRFFNLAPADQQQDGSFVGDEPYAFHNLHPRQPMVSGRLPGLAARVLVSRRGRKGQLEGVRTRLTALWFFPGEERVIEIFQGALEVEEDDASDVDLMVAAVERSGQERPDAHYAAVRDKRADRKNGALEVLQAIGEGHRFFCTQYGQVLVSAAASLGWVDRPLALRRHQGANRSGGSTEHPGEILRRRRALTALHAALDRLDEDKRAVFVLFEIEQLSMREVADAVGCPVQTAYARLYAARALVTQAFPAASAAEGT